jgi:hypothetical protein
MTDKRIAILIYCYPVAYSPTILNTALYWAQRGYCIDLLVDRFVFDEIERQHPNIQVVYCTDLPPLTKSGAGNPSEIKFSRPIAPFLNWTGLL